MLKVFAAALAGYVDGCNPPVFVDATAVLADSLDSALELAREMAAERFREYNPATTAACVLEVTGRPDEHEEAWALAAAAYNRVTSGLLVVAGLVFLAKRSGAGQAESAAEGMEQNCFPCTPGGEHVYQAHDQDMIVRAYFQRADS